MTTNHFEQKLKQVLLPVLKVTICVSLAYLIFYAICINELELRIKEDLALLYIPIGLGAFTTLLSRKHIKRLNYKKDWYRFYYFITTFWVFGLLFFSAKWLVAVSHPLIDITSIKEINKHPGGMYFRISGLKTVPDVNWSAYTITQSQGRTSSTTHLNLYYVTPVVIGSNSPNSFWICKKYHTSTSSRKDGSEMNREFNEFAAYADSEFKRRDFIYSPCFMRLRYSEERIRAVEAIHKGLPQIDEGNLVLLEPQSELPDKNQNSFLKYLLIAFAAGIAMQLILIKIAEPKLRSVKTKAAKPKYVNPAMKQPLSGFRFSYKENKNHIVTIILMIINILTFIVMIFGGVDVLSPFGPDLLKFGALSLNTINDGEWWRLITSLFLHGGIIHLVANMFTLMLIGLMTESHIGKLQYTVLYFMSGIVGNVVSLWFNPHSICVGASGAIFGLFGAAIVMTLTSKKHRDLFPTIAILGGTGLFMGAITPGVSNSAHIGGLITGAALFFILQKAGLTKETARK